MLRLSKLTDYATVIMTFITRGAAPTYAASDVAFNTRIAAPTVSKILKRLTRAGLLRSVRGVQGGYALTRPAGQISLLNIIAAMEAPLAITACSGVHSDCDLEDHCNIRSNWQLISDTISDALAGITLADLAEPMARFNVKLTRYQKLPLLAESKFI